MDKRLVTRIVFCGLLCVAIAGCASSSQIATDTASPINVTGRWEGYWQYGPEMGPFAVTLDQRQSTVTGTTTMSGLQVASYSGGPLQGSVVGNTVDAELLGSDGRR